MAAASRCDFRIVGPAFGGIAPALRGGAMSVLLGLSAARAHAEPLVMYVQVEGGGCPSAALLEQKLAPLLGEDAELAVGTDAGDDAASPRATVEDRGEDYVIEVDGLTREVADAARDCIERARVAAVFIALNVREPPSPAEPPGGEQPPPRLQLGVRLLGEGSYATAIERGAFGAGAGAWLGYDAFFFAVVAGALSTADVALAARDGIAGSVELTRFPLAASASYLLRAGPIAFGPSLGVGVDLLHLRGAGVARPQTELRVNPGARAGADLHVQLTPALSGIATLAVSAFPRAYDLSVDPAGRFARTPRLWLSASLGLDARLH